MSATFLREYDGRLMPLDMLYLDAYAGTLTVADVTVMCSDDRDTVLAPAGMTATFDGQAFPLSGADYRIAVTGTLTLSIDPTGLAAGIYTASFLLLSGQWQGCGRMMWSRAGFGVGGMARVTTSPLVYVSVYTLTAPSASPPRVPTSSWR